MRCELVWFVFSSFFVYVVIGVVVFVWLGALVYGCFVFEVDASQGGRNGFAVARLLT